MMVRASSGRSTWWPPVPGSASAGVMTTLLVNLWRGVAVTVVLAAVAAAA